MHHEENHHNAGLCLCVNWAICNESPITGCVCVCACVCMSWVILNRNQQRLHHCILIFPVQIDAIYSPGG